ncbi:MAG TPA: TIM barrel protein [Mycobacteriales bacterium]|jgi:sugar phosphate isomerase/epimerase|nr:TIM barrel protein [Mycobacteriales bacterium]
MKRPISLAHLTVIELAPPSTVAVAAEAGYDMVDLRLGRAVPTDTEYPLGNSPLIRETARRLSDTGLRVFDVEIVWIQKPFRVADFEPMFEAAAYLGAQRIKVGAKESDETVVADSLAEICQFIAPFGLTADLEFMPFNGIRTLQQAARVVELAEHGNAGILIDTLHLNRSGGHPSEISAFDPALFGYVQLCDAPAMSPPNLKAITREARTGRLFPGEGGLPLVDVLRALPAGIPVSLELPMKALAAKVSAVERARTAIAAARRVIESASAPGSDR